jgi:hypothetical protein
VNRLQAAQTVCFMSDLAMLLNLTLVVGREKPSKQRSKLSSFGWCTNAMVIDEDGTVISAHIVHREKRLHVLTIRASRPPTRIRGHRLASPTPATTLGAACRRLVALTQTVVVERTEGPTPDGRIPTFVLTRGWRKLLDALGQKERFPAEWIGHVYSSTPA